MIRRGFLILLFLFPGVTFSATIHVPGDYPTIQQAIDAAVNGDTVLVSMGTYPENINFKGKAITVKSSMGAFLTIIDGGTPVDPKVASVVTFDHNENSGSVLEGFTITNGTGTQYGGNDEYFGCGIFCLNGASPTIKNNIITENTNLPGKSCFGGGICCAYASDATITGNTITSNSLNSLDITEGGGIYTRDSSPTIENNTITNNNSKMGGGIRCVGWLWGTGHSAALIRYNSITGNTANDGGGMSFQGFLGGTSVEVVSNNTISGNTASSSGGGILCYYTATTVRSNTISQNTAQWGGGVQISDGNNQIVDNTIELNSSTKGGGIICEKNFGGTLVQGNQVTKNTSAYGGGIYTIESQATITGNRILENHATTGGGGMWCSHNPSESVISSNVFAKNQADQDGGGLVCTGSSTQKLVHNTFYQNSAVSKGGGMYIMGTSNVDLSNAILWGDNAATGVEIRVEGTSTLSTGYSDVEGGKILVDVEAGSTLNWGSGNIDTDPLFVDPVSFDFHLSQDPCQPGVVNPCVNTGDPAALMIPGSTRTDGLQDVGIPDMGYHHGPYHLLVADVHEISEATGGTVNFTLSAGVGNANREYIVLGSITGTSPGTPLPGGKALLPVNWDVFTNIVITLLNTPIFDNFMGTLDTNGSATAKLLLYPTPGLAGLTMYFAFALPFPWDVVSNAEAIKIVP